MNIKTNRIIHVIHHSAIIISVSFIFMIFILKQDKYDAIPNSVIIGIIAFVWLSLFGRTHGYLK